jgi:hypothetical protein
MRCSAPSSLLAACFALTACTTLPTGPGIPALPGSGKTLEEFQGDDAACQQYASAQLAQSAAGRAPSAFYELQRRYDFLYIQCMYSRGHKVPVLGAYTSTPPGTISPPKQPPPATPE